MRGPIDYIIVGFEGGEFDGSILKELSNAIDKGIIGLIALSVIDKDKNGKVTAVNLAESGNSFLIEFAHKYPGEKRLLDKDDIDEMADVLENNTAAALLVIEQLWAKPLKKSILDAGGVLVSEGRIHPDAAQELDT